MGQCDFSNRLNLSHPLDSSFQFKPPSLFARKNLLALVLSALAFDELADLISDCGHHRQQRRVRGLWLAGKELGDARNVGADFDWKTKSRSQPGPFSKRPARKIRIGMKICYP